MVCFVFYVNMLADIGHLSACCWKRALPVRTCGASTCIPTRRERISSSATPLSISVPGKGIPAGMFLTPGFERLSSKLSDILLSDNEARFPGKRPLGRNAVSATRTTTSPSAVRAAPARSSSLTPPATTNSRWKSDVTGRDRHQTRSGTLSRTVKEISISLLADEADNKMVDPYIRSGDFSSPVHYSPTFSLCKPKKTPRTASVPG